MIVLMLAFFLTQAATAIVLLVDTAFAVQLNEMYRTVITDDLNMVQKLVCTRNNKLKEISKQSPTAKLFVIYYKIIDLVILFYKS